MVLQDPMTSLNPVQRIGEQIGEMLSEHTPLDKEQIRGRVIELLGEVGIPHPEGRARDYPHQFSGGMRQRVGVAIALACNPTLLIADEPTTALDVTIQAQILELIDERRRAAGTSLVLITHDLGVVAGMCDRTVVMYAGRVVEEGRTADVFADPRMPYTIGLLESIPRVDSAGERLVPIPGSPPNPADLPSGCPFRPRCRWATDRCAAERPVLREIAPGHRIACHADVTHDAPTGTPR
jgi:oligopeptide transport system ATP-binding protein